MQNPETFIKNLLRKKFPDMDNSAINLMIEDTIPVFQDWLFAKINAELTIEHNAELADLMQDENFDMQAVYQFLNMHIDNYPTWLEQRYQEFAKRYTEEVHYSKLNN